MIEPHYQPRLHRLALATAIATFPLIFMGGLVTSKQAGMSVPDWPNSYGYNMFTFPPSMWVGGIFYEHTHRLMGCVVGFLSIMLAIAAWKIEPRAWVRWLCLGVLAAVIFQGVLGGLRVIWVNLNLAVVHGCFAQAFFCMAALAAVVTSQWWHEAPDLSRSPQRFTGMRVVVLAMACIIAIYAQLIAGALMRHYEAGLAIPDLPLAYGRVLPPINAEQLDAANQLRMWDLHMPPTTLAQVWLHFVHRVGAIIVSVVIIATVVKVLRNLRHQRALLVPAVALLVLLAAQVTLGVLTVLMKKPADIATAHVAVGAVVLVTAFVLWVRSARLYVRRVSVARVENREREGVMMGAVAPAR